MQLSQVKSFINAVKESNINTYCFLDDIGTRYYNDNERSVVVVNESDSTLWNFRKSLPTEPGNGILVSSNDINDIRRAQIVGNYNQIKEFVNKYGLSLTDDQLKILLVLDNVNKEVMPITGDYHNIFHKLSKEEYEALTPEKKAEYDAHVAEEEKRYALPKGTPAQITV